VASTPNCLRCRLRGIDEPVPVEGIPGLNDPGVAKDTFAEIAADAKTHCPVSRALKANITLDAKLE
jgi:hypothetical protein